jgi:hypothetical protein
MHYFHEPDMMRRLEPTSRSAPRDDLLGGVVNCLRVAECVSRVLLGACLVVGELGCRHDR